jgi:hypothetical protein
MEAPQVGGQIAPLADYNYTTYPPSPNGAGDFDYAGVQKGAPGTPTYSNARLDLTYPNDAGVMIQNGAQVSTPSAPGNNGQAFNVAYGPTAPSAPTN